MSVHDNPRAVDDRFSSGVALRAMEHDRGQAPAGWTGPAEGHLDHLAFRARFSETGIGAAVVSSRYENGERIWDCIVGGDEKWQYVSVIGTDFGPFEVLPPEEIEDGIERFAATLPAADRLHQLINANPLHIDRHGNVTD